MSTYWIVGQDLWGKAADLVVTEADPMEAARTAIEKFGFLKLDLIQVIAASELRNDLPDEA
jgi:hypothetical protein